MQQIQNIIKTSFHPMEGSNWENSQQNSVLDNEEQQKECQLCMNEFSRTNPPMRVCIRDHNMCQKCVEQNLFLQKAINQWNVQKSVYYCPFCQARINSRKIVINYKLLNAIKNWDKKQQTESKKSIQKTSVSLFEKLSEQNYRLIMNFISQNDKIQLSSTNLFLRSLLMTDQIWGEFEISDFLSMNFNYQQNVNFRLRWIDKYFCVIKPHQVRIIISNFLDDENLFSFFRERYGWVTKLTLFCESLYIHLSVSKACTQVNFLSVSSCIFSDELFESMAKSMKKIKHFQVIKDDINFTAKNISKYFPEGLESIKLKSHMIEFEQIALLAKQNPQNLTQIELDIEDCSQQTLIEILKPLTNLQVLKLFHMQNIHIPQKLAESLSSNVRELYLTKAYEMQVGLIIQKIASPKLLTLDFTEVNMLDDNNIEMIAKKCPYLKRLNISWCTKVSEGSVAKLIRSCLSLQYLNLTGLKCLTDKVFEDYVQFLPIFDEDKYDSVKHHIAMAMEQGQHVESMTYETGFFLKTQKNSETQQKIAKIKSMKKLKELNCVSCNGVSDGILKLIYLANRKANTVNYYGNCMGLYTNQDIYGSF